MAKVHTVAHGNPANGAWQVWAAVIDEVRRDAKLTVDEFAGVIERDPRQVGKWLNATERPQIETVFAFEQFQQPAVLALARRVKSIRITTQITVGAA
jgi:hypothetical protein